MLFVMVITRDLEVSNIDAYYCVYTIGGENNMVIYDTNLDAVYCKRNRWKHGK